MKDSDSFLSYYLRFFGDRRLLVVELLPEWADTDQPHVELVNSKGFVAPLNEDEAEDINKHRHPCWCNPRLIYADDDKGNEVWLHNSTQ